MAKQLTIYFLLLLWVGQSTLGCLVFQMQRAHYRRSQFATVRTFSRQYKNFIFTFNSLEDIPWEVEGKEFSLDYRLYDVISLQDADGKITVLCHLDEKEASFVAGFLKDNFTKKPLKHSRTGKDKWPEIKCLPEETLPVCMGKQEHSHQVFAGERLQLSSFNREISPPPEFVYHFIRPV